MADTLTEMQGCDLLARLFSKRGYAIERNVMFREYGVEFHIDGWDPRARVGFEFLTSEDDDHIDLTLEEYNELTAAQRRGELALFIIDEVEPLAAEDLAAEAHEFLDEVADAIHARLKAGTRGPKKAKKKTARKAAAASGRAAAKKPVRAEKKSVKKAVAKPAKKVIAAKAAKKTPKTALKKKAKKKAATSRGSRR
jgi:hypothetical protein